MDARSSTLRTAAWAALLVALVPVLPAVALPGGGKTPGPIVAADPNMPPQLEGVGVQERLGELAPLDVELTDSYGRPVRLKDALPRTRPALVTLVYYNCPMLCNLVINEQVRSMREVGLELGKDYEAVVVSIDPKDTPMQSLERKRRHLAALGKPESAPWHFLTGSEENIRKLAEGLGFKYRYDEETKQFVHPAVVHVLSPEGGISRYLYGTSFPAKDMRLALLEAADGRVGTSLDRVILSCFKYDPASRKYGVYIFGFIRLGALSVFFGLAGVLIHYWRRELKKGAVA
jgi:protein SCO1